MKFDYFIVVPKQSQDINSELSSVLNEFDLSIKEYQISHSQIIKLAVFYNPSCCENYLELISEKVKKHFSEGIPAISFLAQPPIGNANIIIEASYVTDSKSEVNYKEYDNTFYTIAGNSNEKHLFISGLQSNDKNQDTQKQSEDAFKKLESILHHEGVKFSDIIRQWNYIEDILNESKGKQHYQVFNDVRTKYYNKNGLISDYPAATGIGVKEGGVILEIHAVKPAPEIKLSEIANPLQTDAFDYSEKMLEGKPIDEFAHKSTPKFSRAKLAEYSDHAQVLVSGTASILGEETIGINDISKQTHVTINNIQQLISPEILRKHQIEFNTALQSFNNIRVYIKSKNNIDVVKTICENYFSSSNIVFIEADICRNNLLVEIEGTVCINKFN